MSLESSKYHNAHKHHKSKTSNQPKSYSRNEITEVAEESTINRNSDNELDLLSLFILFWDGKKKFLIITGLFLMIGVLYILFSPTEYQSNATLLPESQNSRSVASSLISQYGGLIGVGGNFANTEAGITPGLYPDIIESLPYQVELVNHTIYFSNIDTSLVLYDYLLNYYPVSTLDYIRNYTIGLPSLIKKIFSEGQKVSSENTIPSKINRDLVVSLTAEQKGAISKMRERLTIEEEDGLITLKAEMPDPYAAAEIGKVGIKLLKEYVREYRTQKASEELEFIEQQLTEAKQEFEDAQQKLAEFRDSNLNLSTAKARTKEQELKSQYDLAFNLYNSLAQKLQEAKLRVKEETPVFTSLQPFQKPASKSKPNTTIIILISIITGLFVSSVYILGYKVFEELKYQIQNRNFG